MRISETQIIAACEIARRTFIANVTLKEGVHTLVSEHNLNGATAHDFIYDYKCLLQGKVFHRAMSAPAMRYFMLQIFNTYGQSERVNAVKSLWQHIEYYENHYRTKMKSLRAVASEFEVLLNRNKTIDEMEREFNQAIEKSVQESSELRLERLASATKIPRSTIVNATVFIRNPDVVAEVLLRANGICEGCNNPAPFIKAKDGSPYLEIHHKTQLSKGGEDSIENAVALCPNCHRESHFGSRSA
jgi:5-methylcytosine-specific restriction enzyme A